MSEKHKKARLSVQLGFFHFNSTLADLFFRRIFQLFTPTLKGES